MPAGRLLALCALWCAFSLNVKTVYLLPTQYPEDAAPENLARDPQMYTSPNGIKCEMCPPGYYVFKHCTVFGTKGVCYSCENGTFYNSWNSNERCRRCKVCRTLDEVEIKPCVTTRNTECACKNGSFCSPERPCETCHKCMPSCPPGEEKVQECTPTSNLQCRPIPASPSPPTGSQEVRHIVVWVLGILAFVLLVALVVYCWKKSRSFRNFCTALWSSKTIQFLRCLQSSPSEGQQERQDNMWNDRIDQESRQPLQSVTTSGTEATVGMWVPPTAPPLEGVSKNKNAAAGRGGLEFSTEKKLVPVNGKNSVDALSRSFDVFIRKVPLKEWNMYMRALDLTDNEIESAEGNFIREKQYDMLRTWREKKGKAASVNDLLKELCGIGFRGIAEDIESKLTADGFYVYEE